MRLKTWKAKHAGAGLDDVAVRDAAVVDDREALRAAAKNLLEAQRAFREEANAVWKDHAG